ncbi:MAG: CTP synthase [Cytophagales bacterium]|nr:CTP synthase [Cytophagales bacterium]
MSSPKTKKEVKYVFVTGGVASSLGKGILAASLGKILESRGLSVTLQKIDPYINIDSGTLNPYEHGECFVTEDGAETDLDLGHYERFLGKPTSRGSNFTAGRIYHNLIAQERRGDFLGKTIQVIPHVTNEIKKLIYQLGNQENCDIVITEIGGCVGDIESLPFLEAVRQIRLELGNTSTAFAHLTLVPYLKAVGELKTKPTQQSVKELLSLGIQPDVLVCRCTQELPKEIRQKIALHCNLSLDRVVEAKDTHIIYEVPLALRKEKLDEQILNQLQVSKPKKPDLKLWENFLNRLKNPRENIRIAIVGKYVQLKDAYRSIYESLVHAGAHTKSSVQILWISAEEINTANVEEKLHKAAGILVAPGFGERGLEGKMNAVQYAREQKIPFLGICLGMQCAVVEFARHALKLPQADSTEISPQTPDPVIDIMASQKELENRGGTMRLGAYPCKLQKKTKAFEAYQTSQISERHRHRYEFNTRYAKKFQEAGMKSTGLSPDGRLVEIVEIEDHPWFIGCQFHPEYKSTVEKPHPLFICFVQAAIRQEEIKSITYQQN